MIVVFKETCIPETSFTSAFPCYEKGIGYEVGASISQEDADKYIAEGKASVVGAEEKKKLGAKPGSKEVRA